MQMDKRAELGIALGAAVLAACAGPQKAEAPDAPSNEGFIKPTPVITPIDTELDWNRIHAMRYALLRAATNCGATLAIGDHGFAVVAYWLNRPIDDNPAYLEWFFSEGEIRPDLGKKYIVEVKNNRNGQTYRSGVDPNDPINNPDFFMFRINGTFYPEEAGIEAPYTVLLESLNNDEAEVLAKVSPRMPKKCW